MISSSPQSTIVNNVLRNFNSAVNENAAVFSERCRPLYITELVDKFTKEGIGRIRNDDKAVRPWNRDDLLKRIKTFSPCSWFAKPDVISPIKCASSGWINSGIDTLYCWNCKSTLKHIFDDISGENLSNSLHSQHSSTCAWNNNICDENLIYLPWNSKEEYIACYQKRVNDLKCLKGYEVIEFIEIVFPKSILNFYYLPEYPTLAQSTDEQMYQKLNETMTFFLVNLSLDKYLENRQHFHYSKLEVLLSTLALFGWTTPHPAKATGTAITTTTTTDSSAAAVEILPPHTCWIECQYCYRKIDLKYYLPQDLTTNESSTTTTATSTATIHSTTQRSFHPIDQHHYWCPWSRLNLEDVLQHHHSSSHSTSATITNILSTTDATIPGIVRFLATVKEIDPLTTEIQEDSNTHSIETTGEVISTATSTATSTAALSAVGVLGEKRSLRATASDDHDRSSNSSSSTVDKQWLEDAYKRIRLALDLVVTKSKLTNSISS